MKLFTKILFQIIIVAAILLLFSGHFNLQARHKQLRTDFDGHWHYQPKDVPDFTFEAVQDEFDGMDIGIIPDQFEMLYSPSNYTPDIAPSSTTDKQLASHLKGIDDALLALSERIAALE